VSDIPDRLRSEAVARANGCCEYCLMPVEGQVAWFPIDHIIPRSGGGQTESSNLAMACPRCNGHKWAAESGTDPKTGQNVSLFHPRRQRWTDHFRWSPLAAFEVEGLTPCGRATVDRLKMNDPEVVSIRHVLAGLGIQFRHRKEYSA
jgi:hypothetical protein